MLLGIIGYALVIWLFAFMAKAARNNSRNRFAVALLWLFEGLLNTIEQVTNDKKMARQLAPLAITLFFFIIVNYWTGILPFVGPVTYNGLPLFRGLAADLNVTFALAIISMVTVQIYAIRAHGAFGNLGRYLRNPFRDPAGAFEGVLEIIAEFSRLVALSMRLFGNVFAGEVLLVMVGFLTSYFAVIALPFFMVFELFIGAIQAYVFFMLTIVFISLGTASHGPHETHDTETSLDNNPSPTSPPHTHPDKHAKAAALSD
ncbi:F0F1 ATP synthase subunit A [Candidatus Saccharibacteria bacterium]|nr:F0F1 ATP synthase subunit A [Candidatus Saccharibacteria bacterium]